MQQPKFEIYCDFDGTVTRQDVVNLLLDKLADSQWLDIEAKWLEGKIGSRECLSEQIPLIQGGWQAIEKILNHEVELEPDFKSFSTWCSKNSIPLYIVSDGLDRVINTVFSKQNINVTSVWSNKLEITEGTKTTIKFPYPPKDLDCKLGLCKCQVLEESKAKTMKIVIGDGFSDICWAKKGDLIFAKSHLLDFCKNNNLPFQEFKNFTQVSSYVDKHLEKDSFKTINLNSSKKQDTKTAVLLIHGLTGTPKEMKPIAKHLNNLGYKVETPLLAGHGLGHEEMISATWQDWLESARLALNNLTNDFDNIYIVGLSVGSLIAALLAEENPKVKGLTLLSIAYGTPSQGTPKLKCLLPLVFKFPFLRKYFFWTEGPPYGIKDKRLQRNIQRIMTVSNQGETTQHGFFRTYVESLYQHKLLEKEVRKEAANISCPILIVHSLEDTMLSPVNAVSIYQELGSKDKLIKFITGCDHVMTVDLKRNEIAKEIEYFIKRTSKTENINSTSFQEELTCEITPEYITSEINAPDYFGNVGSILNKVGCNFKNHLITIKKGELPVLQLSLIETKIKIKDLIPNPLKQVFNLFAAIFPNISTLQFLGIRDIGINLDSETEQNNIHTARELASQALHFLTSNLSTDIISFTSFSEREKPLLRKLTEFKPSNHNSTIFTKKKNTILPFVSSSLI